MESPAAILRRYGLRPKKSWGQCFLHDPATVRKIVEHADVGASDTVVEIGAGLGTLTGELARVAGRVVAIERDRDLAEVLRREFAENSRVEVAEENALTFDFSALPGPVTVVGNLPYNISSPLLFHLISNWRWVRSATIMMQKEVVDRLVARQGTRAYGIPSVICRQFAEVNACFKVNRRVFVPVPGVDSAVVRLVMRAKPLFPCDQDLFRDVVHAAFRTRRKTLKNALELTYLPALVRSALDAAGIDGRRRGETLTVEEYATLARCLAAVRTQG